MLYLFPISGESNYAIPWANWYRYGGLEGEIPKDVKAPIVEPLAPARKQMELYNQIKGTSDPGKQADLMKRILDIAADQFWCMGISLPVEGYGIVKNDFHNVPKKMATSWVFLDPASTNSQQFFIEESCICLINSGRENRDGLRSRRLGVYP